MLFRSFLGTLLLVAAVVGSGIQGERLADGNPAVALLANTGATVAALYVLITLFGPLSGAHFNPMVTAALSLRGVFPWRNALPYSIAQIAGASAGAMLADAMFALPIVNLSHADRFAAPLWL